jgi:hypothetical protein
MKFTHVAFCVCALLCAALTASAQTIDFNRDKAGEPPKGFSTALTGQGKAGVWVVMKDDTSPGQGNVLAQTDADATGYRFPLCVHDGVTAKDADISVKFKPVSGKKDQAAGIVWRYRDNDNYYIVRANALENNVVLYKAPQRQARGFAAQGRGPHIRQESGRAEEPMERTARDGQRQSLHRLAERAEAL